MQTANFLNEIHEGMKVLDRGNHEIGKVDFVQIGSDNPATEVAEASEVSDIERDRESPLVETIEDIFAPDELPQELRDRLLLEGYVRIDANGLFAADRYVTPDQISSISGDSIVLDVDKDDLLKRH